MSIENQTPLGKTETPSPAFAVVTGSDGWEELLESLERLQKGHEKFGDYACALCCQEARRRLVNQRSHLEAMHCALDGLPINHIPGAGMDGHRDKRNLRAVVEHLLNQNIRDEPALGRAAASKPKKDNV